MAHPFRVLLLTFVNWKYF